MTAVYQVAEDGRNHKARIRVYFPLFSGRFWTLLGGPAMHEGCTRRALLLKCNPRSLSSKIDKNSFRRLMYYWVLGTRTKTGSVLSQVS